MDWIIAHWEQIVAIAGAVVMLARLIVKVTPTQKDDAVLAKVVTVLAHIALAMPEKLTKPTEPATEEAKVPGTSPLPFLVWAALGIGIACSVACTGCGGAFEDSQKVQVLAMTQVRDEMIAFEIAALEQIRKDKAQAIDLAWRWDLADASKDGQVPLAVVLTKDKERKALVAKGESDLKSLDADFKLRIRVLERAMALGGYSLDAMTQWTRAGKALQGLFLRAPDVTDLAAETEKPPPTPASATAPNVDAEVPTVPAVPANK